MTKEDILNMSRTAGLNPKSFFMESKLKRFAELIAEVEREACAKLCEKTERYRGDFFAATIRARGQQ